MSGLPSWLRPRAMVGLAIALQCAGCATAPIEETKAFSSAVTAVRSAGDLLLDELNVAERNQRLKVIRSNPRAQYNFATADAYYYASIAEAPDTAIFRSSLQIIQDYADLLLSLVEGRNIDVARGQLETIATKIAELARFPGVPAAFGQLSPLIDQALLAQSRAEARQLVIQGAPAIVGVIESLEDAAPVMFRVLIYDLRTEPQTGTQRNAKIEGYRTAVANYVVLLDRLRATFERLAGAYEQPSNVVTLAALADAAGQLNADVKAVRQALVTLRRGGAS